MDTWIAQFHDDLMRLAIREQRNCFRIDGDAVDFG